jgi:hypothetical protein
MAEAPNFSHTRVRVPRLNPVRGGRGGSDIAAALAQLSTSIGDIGGTIARVSKEKNVETMEAWDIAVQAKAQLDTTGDLDADIAEFEANSDFTIAHNFGRAKASHDVQRGKEAGNILGIAEDDRLANGEYQTEGDYLTDQAKSMDEFEAMGESPEFIVGMSSTYMKHSVKMGNAVAKYESEQSLIAHRVAGAATINRGADTFYNGAGTIEEREAIQDVNIQEQLTLLRESFPNNTDNEIASLFLLDLETDLLDDTKLEPMSSRIVAIMDAGIIKEPEDLKRFEQIKSDRMARITKMYNKVETQSDKDIHDEWIEKAAKQWHQDGVISVELRDEMAEDIGFAKTADILNELETDVVGQAKIMHLSEATALLTTVLGNAWGEQESMQLRALLNDPAFKKTMDGNPFTQKKLAAAQKELGIIEGKEDKALLQVYEDTKKLVVEMGYLVGTVEQINEQLIPFKEALMAQQDKSPEALKKTAESFEAGAEKRRNTQLDQPEEVLKRMLKGWGEPDSTIRWEALITGQTDVVVPIQEKYEEALKVYEDAKAETLGKPGPHGFGARSGAILTPEWRAMQAARDKLDVIEDKLDVEANRLQKYKRLRDSSDSYNPTEGGVDEVSFIDIYSPHNESLINLMRYA